MKNTWIILLILVVVTMAAGCSSSNNQNKSAEPSLEQPSEASLEQPIEPVSTEVSETSSQDDAWIKYVESSMRDVRSHTEFETPGTAGLNTEQIHSTAKELINVTQKVIDENEQYTVSPKYEEARNEWIAGLKDYNAAGNYMLLYDGNSYANENYIKGDSLRKSGSSHFLNTTGLIYGN